ncbi:MAG: DUF2281 domain-containing protein [Treponema sp.]|jgi:hypothetical protein|nr:DUF2281 domain-containing protein [Treponema sp.]
MTQQAELLKKIDKLPPKYFGEVIDFVGYLQAKAQQAAAQAEPAAQKYNSEQSSGDEVAAYKAMAADIEREQEASEWCNAYFGPANQ